MFKLPPVDQGAAQTTARASRRRFFGQAGAVGLGVLAANHLLARDASAQTINNDIAVLNFALHLEYLEGELYTRAAFGRGLTDADTSGTGTRGAVIGGRPVKFETEFVRQFFSEVAADEEAHVRYLRRTITNLGGQPAARPTINYRDAFTAAARSAGLVGPTQFFDPTADENSLLLAGFLFADVGVTAYLGGGRILQNRNVLDGAAGILATEAYHIGTVRALLFSRGLGAATNLISDARDRLDNTGEALVVADDDQGTRGTGLSGPDATGANIVNADADAIAFARTPRQVLNIAFLTSDSTATRGGFFPDGINIS